MVSASRPLVVVEIDPASWPIWYLQVNLVPAGAETLTWRLLLRPNVVQPVRRKQRVIAAMAMDFLSIGFWQWSVSVLVRDAIPNGFTELA